MWLYILFAFAIVILIISLLLTKKKRGLYGFFIVFGEFGSGKTRNVTSYLKEADKETINIANYYTGYNHLQVESHLDIFYLFQDLYDFMFYYRLLFSNNIQKIFTHKQETFVIYIENFIEFTKNIDLVSLSRSVENWKAKHESDFILTNSRNLLSISMWEDAETFMQILFDYNYFDLWNPDTKFNIILDEASIYFNNREFSENFKGEKKGILEYIYQVRKFNVLFFCIVQNPAELDMKFRRLAMYFRKFYKGIWRWQWYRDYYFVNPDELDLNLAEEVGGGMFSGAFFNLFPYKQLDYLTNEGISIRNNVYRKGKVFQLMNSNYLDKEKDINNMDSLSII